MEELREELGDGGHGRFQPIRRLSGRPVCKSSERTERVYISASNAKK